MRPEAQSLTTSTLASGPWMPSFHAALWWPGWPFY